MPYRQARQGRVLIIDQRNTHPVLLCRHLTSKGFVVDAIAEAEAPVFRSRHCRGRFTAPPWYAGAAYLARLTSVVEDGAYDAIYLCSEAVLELLVDRLGRSARWRALPVPAEWSLRAALSKNAALDLVKAAGVAVPRTVVPADERELGAIAGELGFPLVVKGEKGESAQNVRIARDASELIPCYREIVAREVDYGGRPAIQEFVPGELYCIGGLFCDGRPLRVCAHRKVLMLPPEGGVTVKGITERPAGLLDSVFRVFEAFRYTGLGMVDFIRDARDGSFRFLEINPRVWAAIEMASCAGVDLYTPYRDLAQGRLVAPNLGYREGVQYHRIARELRLIRERPGRLPGFIKDCLDPRVYSDFDPRDPRPHLPSWRQLRAVRGPDRVAESVAT